MADRDRLKAALRYARRGWAVFPLNGKKPFRGTAGHNDATTNEKMIHSWWKKWPDANVGIACDSQRGPIVLDIDGPSGHSLLKTLELPLTRSASSRSGRLHLYFDPMTDGTAVPRLIRLKRDGVKYAFDILGDGGYVVAPPSIHPDTGKPYEWTSKRTVVPLPEVIKTLIRQHRRTTEQAAPLPAIIGEGERDTLLTSLAGSMRRRGASEEAILAALREENATRVEPPLDDRDLRRIAKSIARKPPAGLGEHLTELGNARRFVQQHADHVRSVGGRHRRWMIWENVRWQADTTGEVERFAKTTVRGLYTEAAHTVDQEERDNILKHASKSEQAHKVRAMLELASTEPEVAMATDAFDSDPWLFNVENGTLDLRTGLLLPHKREHLITKLAPVEYRPKAKAPRWEQFLLEIMDGDAELVEFLQRAIGYSMTGDIREHCLFFLYGRGSNGKSTFLEVLRDLFGDYSQQSEFSTFLARRNEGPRNDLARMRGARLVTASEADQDKSFDTTVLKTLTGGDTVTARKLYEDLFEFRPQHKIFLAANHKPIVKEQTEAFWRRLRLVPFTVTFTKEQRDNKLRSTLEKELPGILNWALEGSQLWLASGLNEPKAVKKATAAYREENDLVGEFIEQRCRFNEDAWTSTTKLYQEFSEWWVETRGPRSQPVSMGWFSRMLSERPELTNVKRARIRGWRGIGLQQEIRT